MFPSPTCSIPRSFASLPVSSVSPLSTCPFDLSSWCVVRFSLASIGLSGAPVAAAAAVDLFEWLAPVVADGRKLCFRRQLPIPSRRVAGHPTGPKRSGGAARLDAPPDGMVSPAPTVSHAACRSTAILPSGHGFECRRRRMAVSGG